MAGRGHGGAEHEEDEAGILGQCIEQGDSSMMLRDNICCNYSWLTCMDGDINGVVGQRLRFMQISP
eukprot:scaffold17140_cov33-Prasinocladus_malaysianus.AAC.1